MDISYKFARFIAFSWLFLSLLDKIVIPSRAFDSSTKRRPRLLRLLLDK